MPLPKNINMERIRQDLKERGKLLALDDTDSCLAVSCLLHDLCYDFSVVIEDNDKADPFADPKEEQFTELHRLFRTELKKKPYCYTEKDFKQLYKQTMALSAMFLKACIVRAYNGRSDTRKNRE